MTRDTALLNELWGIVKPHIAAKERIHVADELVELFDEYGMADGIENEIDIDKDLKVAAMSFFCSSDEEMEEEDEWD